MVGTRSESGAPGSRVLDAGAGEQQFKGICRRLQYVSQDVAEYDGAGNAHGLYTGTWDCSGLDIVSDISAIPEPDSSLDVILWTEVFEHLPNPLLAIAEFSRLLKPGGVLILTAPFCSLTHFAPYHYSTGLNRYYCEYHLPHYGFNVVETIADGGYFDYVAQETRRVPQVAASHSSERLSRMERIHLAFTLRHLNRLQWKGRGLSELLTFGLHVRAVRVRTAQRCSEPNVK